MLSTSLRELEKAGLHLEIRWEHLKEGLQSQKKSALERLLNFFGVRRDEIQDKTVPLVDILEINGLPDALRALRSVQGHEAAIRLFACEYAKMVFLDVYECAYPKDNRPRYALQMADWYARGKYRVEEYVQAIDAAWEASQDAEYDASNKRAFLASTFIAYAAEGFVEVPKAGFKREDHILKEFIRLCRLQGKYAESTVLPAKVA